MDEATADNDEIEMMSIDHWLMFGHFSYDYDEILSSALVKKRYAYARKLYKASRTKFAAFIKEYKDGKIPQLNAEEKEALAKLHGLWKNATYTTIKQKNFMHFWVMKDENMKLNLKLLEHNDAWTEYFLSTYEFCESLQMFAFALMIGPPDENASVPHRCTRDFCFCPGDPYSACI